MAAKAGQGSCGGADARRELGPARGKRFQYPALVERPSANGFAPLRASASPREPNRLAAIGPAIQNPFSLGPLDRCGTVPEVTMRQLIVFLALLAAPAAAQEATGPDAALAEIGAHRIDLHVGCSIPVPALWNAPPSEQRAAAARRAA